MGHTRVVMYPTSHIAVFAVNVILLSHFVCALTFAHNQTGPRVPAVIVFGDSIMDTGNNNEIPTIAKSNFLPYGMDFPGGKPTGRFSNGRIPSDFVAIRMGLKDLLPPYLDSKLLPRDMLTGVSFASAGTGYDPLTSSILSVIPMQEQLNLFKEYKEKLNTLAGLERASTIISKSLYIVCSGTNDVANTYFSGHLRKLQYDVPSYVDWITVLASSYLKELSLLGARNIGFVGLPPIGCLPSQRSIAGGMQRDCESTRNQAALLFNSKIRMEIEKLTKELNGTKIIYLDLYSELLDVIQHPSIYGFKESTKGCCGTGEFEFGFMCNTKTSAICEDDTKYVFWDSFHPTERAYEIIVNELVNKFLKYLL